MTVGGMAAWAAALSPPPPPPPCADACAEPVVRRVSLDDSQEVAFFNLFCGTAGVAAGSAAVSLAALVEPGEKPVSRGMRQQRTPTTRYPFWRRHVKSMCRGNATQRCSDARSWMDLYAASKAASTSRMFVSPMNVMSSVTSDSVSCDVNALPAAMRARTPTQQQQIQVGHDKESKEGRMFQHLFPHSSDASNTN